MIDVFVRCWCTSPIRTALAEAVIYRLAAESELGYVTLLVSDATDHVISYPDHAMLRMQVPAADFHRESKRLAAKLSDSESLIILDDDQIPLYRGWVAKGEEIINGLPEFSAVAGWSVTHEVPKPKGPRGYVEVSDSIGCPMVVRRDALLAATEESIDDLARADTILTQRLQRYGPTGITADWRYIHAGMGLSQVIPQHWMPEVPA